MISRTPLILDSAMLDEAKTYLRIETEEEDSALGAILLAALGHAETFLNLLLVRRAVTERLVAGTTWTRLSDAPVVSITALTSARPGGLPEPLPPDRYALDIDGSGEGWVRISDAMCAGPVAVSYEAGLTEGWADLPEALRLGVLRLAGYLHGRRDAAEDAGPPAAVAALLKPWRRFRLS